MRLMPSVAACTHIGVTPLAWLPVERVSCASRRFAPGHSFSSRAIRMISDLSQPAFLSSLQVKIRGLECDVLHAQLLGFEPA